MGVSQVAASGKPEAGVPYMKGVRLAWSDMPVDVSLAC
jgi:hypothetical protein